MKIYTIILLCLWANWSLAQGSDRLLVHLEKRTTLIAGISNYVTLFVLGDSTTAYMSTVTARLETAYTFSYDKPPIVLTLQRQGNQIWLRPDSLGMVTFEVVSNGDTLKKTMGVAPLEGVARLGGIYGANGSKKTPVDDFKVQLGIVVLLENYGFDARCATDSFEIIRVNTTGIVFRHTNIGGRFGAESSAAIQAAQAGDLYIFRNIYYHCPATEQQRAVDMIFELE